MGSAAQVQILNKTVCISCCANALVNVLNQSLLLPALGKIVMQTGSFSFGMATGREENSEF